MANRSLINANSSQTNSQEPKILTLTYPKTQKRKTLRESTGSDPIHEIADTDIISTQNAPTAEAIGTH